MFDHILNQIQEKVRSREYLLTLHAEDEMIDDGLTYFDVENAGLTGRVEGRTHGSEIAVVVSKFTSSRKLVIITVYVK